MHVHSLYTRLKNGYKKACVGNFVEKIKKENIEVIGLTNYFNFTKGDFKLKKELEAKDVTVFLNLELRLSITNKENDNCDIHIIFDPKLQEDTIETFLSNISVKVKGTEKKASKIASDDDFKNGVVEYNDLLKALRDEALKMEGMYLVGFLSRGKGSSRSSKMYEGIAKKFHFLIHSSDKASNVQEDRKFWLKEEKPLLQSSDAHEIDSIGTKFTWIKADKTFEGLKQIIHEPEERVAIQPIEPRKVSDSYRIDKIVYSLGTEQKVLLMSPYLNSVIGVRASGKSTLLKNVASKIDRKEYETKVKNGTFWEIENLKVIWADGEEDGGESNNKTILFIPQNFLSRLVHANDNGVSKPQLADFIKELYERNSTFKSKLSIWESSNQQLDRKIYDALSSLFDLDSRSKKLGDLIKKEGRSSDVEKSIKQIESDIDKVKEESELSENVFNQYKVDKNHRAEYLTNLESTEQDIASLVHLLDVDLINLDIVFGLDLSEKLEQKITQNLTEKNANVIKFIEEEIKGLKREVQKIKEDITKLDNKIKPIEGRLQKGSLIEDLTKRLNQDKNKLLQIKKLDKEQKELSKKVEPTKKNILAYFSKRERALDSVMNDFRNLGKDFEFIRLEISKHSRGEEFLKLCEEINFHNKSPFKEGKDTQNKAFNFLQKRELESEKDISIIVPDLFNSIFDDDLPLSTNSDKRLFLLRLLSNWYDINYRDSVFNKNDDTKLLDMSDGQKMNSLLELLFSFDDYSFPILIDQPEDDLDVTAITELVVKFIRKKKKQRQIILVSHNAGLVVGSDTENIIIACKHIERRKIKGFTYQNGSIESKDIVSSVIQTLEGGVEAFKKRGKKLGII